MSTSDNPSNKEKKDLSAMKKQSKNEGEEEAGPFNTDQLVARVDKLSIETETSDNHSKKKEITDLSALKKQSEKEEENEAGPSSTDQLPPGPRVEESTPPSDRDQIKVKFLINVPVGVTPEMSERKESHCQTFLDLLRRKAFKKKDEPRLKDIAVVFGFNGKESDKAAIKSESEKISTSEIAFKKFYFTWEEKNKTIPYRKIRETIKDHEHTRNLVKHFRKDNLECIIYFCFFDADTVDFNHVLSSYIDVIHEHKYPTVMSTGYVFPKDSENRVKSERDRQVRIKTAEHFPLGTYYPEPNFCVFLPLGEDTLPEKFDYKRNYENNMESPNLITQVKKRCKAVFADKTPVVTKDSKKGQYHTNPRTWAVSAYAHKELELTYEYIHEIIEKNRGKKLKQTPKDGTPKDKTLKDEKPKEDETPKEDEKPKEETQKEDETQKDLKPKEDEKPKDDETPKEDETPKDEKSKAGKTPKDDEKPKDIKSGRGRNSAHIPLLMALVKDNKTVPKLNRRHFKSPGADQVFQAAKAVRNLMEGDTDQGSNSS
ncbi:hypothetical protein E1301_Tti015948 [Triplophysa tibetana]|uniref:Uncharacterized protein n=1 Tax=Triplophysa tibetana TaxID=1572043 RepID=A0A5A9PE68_9TELE|nr:hypothetical protein E1301_Tti015948 [Triplophysa tibetana]